MKNLSNRDFKIYETTFRTEVHGMDIKVFDDNEVIATYNRDNSSWSLESAYVDEIEYKFTSSQERVIYVMAEDALAEHHYEMSNASTIEDQIAIHERF